MTRRDRTGHVRRVRHWQERARSWPGEILTLLVMFGIWQGAVLTPRPLRAEQGSSQQAADTGRPLYVNNADGTGLRQLIKMPDYTAHGSPEWSGDGTKIAVDAWKPAENETYVNAHILVVNSDGSSPQDLGEGAMPSWSPGGNRIVFSQYSPNNGVWVMCADGSGRKLLDPEGWGIQWSPDGHRLAWSKDGNLTVYDLIEGTLEQVLPQEPQYYSHIYQGFDWSPDSRRVCFKANRSDGGNELVVAPVDDPGEKLKRWPLQSVGPNVAWSPDGKNILISMYNKERKGQQVYLLDPDSDDPPTLLEGQDPTRKNMDAEWSPDGKQIIFSSARKP